MSNHWFKKLVGQTKAREETKAQELKRRSLTPNVDAYVLDVWLERASSLKQLRMHDHAFRVMNMARGITLESMQANPSDPMAWVNIGRVQIADEKFDSAKEVLNHAIELAQKCGNTEVEGYAGSALFQVLRQQPTASQEPFDLTQSLTLEQYRDYQRQNLGKMFCVCQSCGHLNLMLGEHCAHCRYAPQDLSDLQLSVALCADNFNTPTLLQIAQNIQQGRKPSDFIDNLDTLLKKLDVDDAILKKIQRNAEDDHLDFKGLDHCPSCATVVWASSADACPSCHVELNRPMLLKDFWSS
jgi:tetratricopeptide (TPR) repeat protein